MNKPTKKQTTILKFIDEYTVNHDGHSPSYREIQNALGLSSVATVAQHIDNCVTAGFLKKIPGAARSLEVVPFDDHKETVQLIQQKIINLNEKLENREELTDAKAQSIRDDIITLRAAAKILGLDL